MKSIEHALVKIEQKPDGLWCRTWLSDWPSLGEARAEVRRIADEEDQEMVIKVVKAEEWHCGEVEWS